MSLAWRSVFIIPPSVSPLLQQVCGFRGLNNGVLSAVESTLDLQNFFANGSIWENIIGHWVPVLKMCIDILLKLYHEMKSVVSTVCSSKIMLQMISTLLLSSLKLQQLVLLYVVIFVLRFVIFKLETRSLWCLLHYAISITLIWPQESLGYHVTVNIAILLRLL